MRAGVVSALVLLVGLAPSPARAALRDVLPRPFENGAYLDLFGAYERDDNQTGPHSARWSDLFFRERITFYSNGYFYHPRFLLYQLSVSGALKQEQYDSSFLGPLGWAHGTGVEYDTKLIFVPEHPYNLELFARRFEPLFKEQSATHRDNVQTSNGANFRYRRKPLFFHARFNDDAIRSGETTSYVTRLGVGGQLFQRFDGGNQFSLNGEYNPARFSDSFGLEGTSTETLVGGMIDLQRAKLNVSATTNTHDQTSPGSGSVEDDQRAHYENLIIYFPLRFRSEVSNRYYENRSTVRAPGAATERELSDIGKEFRLDVIHRLYESLDSTYRYLRSERSSQGGASNGTANSLTFAYAKKISRGRLLLGANGARQDFESRGRTDVVSEPHPATPVPGTFVLGQANPDPASVALYLLSPLPPFQTVALTESVHWVAVPLGNTLEIDVFNLPAQFAVPGTYELVVSYSILTGAFELRTDIVGVSGSVELFDNLLTPYFSTVAIRSEVRSGFFPGIPLDSTARTVGVRFHRAEWRASTEFQDLDWEVSPYRLWRSEVQYVGALDPTTHLYATGSYVNRWYSQGTSTSLHDPYGEGTASAAGSLQKQFPRQGLLLALGASFSRLNGLVHTNAFSVNSSAMWKIGKLDLTLGVSGYGSDTQGVTSLSDNRRNHEYYYLQLRRKL